MTTVIAFDVNETLLDMRALDPYFEALFGSAALRAQWFAQMLYLSFVGGLTASTSTSPPPSGRRCRCSASARESRLTTLPSPR